MNSANQNLSAKPIPKPLQGGDQPGQQREGQNSPRTSGKKQGQSGGKADALLGDTESAARLWSQKC